MLLEVVINLLHMHYFLFIEISPTILLSSFLYGNFLKNKTINPSAFKNNQIFLQVLLISFIAEHPEQSRTLLILQTGRFKQSDTHHSFAVSYLLPRSKFH